MGWWDGRDCIYPHGPLNNFHSLVSGTDWREKTHDACLRPMSWIEYCQEISSSQCSEATVTATRFPNEDEQDLYCQAGLYTGYFRPTDANNCTLYPTNCTGHIVTPPCTWSSPIDAQLYWNNIVGVARDGPLSPAGRYTQTQILQIYLAANATNNHVILHWYNPEPLYAVFQGTSSEFLTVTLPTQTKECILSRGDTEERCDASFEVRRRTSNAVVCGDDIQILQRLIATIAPDHTYSLPDVDQSPAYELLKDLQISNLDMDSIIRRWKQIDVEPMGNDIRLAVCEWVVDNLSTANDAIRKRYPRQLTSRSKYKGAGYLLFARVFGSAVAIMAFVLFLAVFKFRNTKTMIFTQPIFLHLILIGFMLIAVGAVLFTIKPNETHCVSSSWLLLLGYTIELVPVLVKTAKINKLIRSYSKSQTRIQLKRRTMLLEVAVVVLGVVSFLIAWAVVDPPLPLERRTLQTSADSIGETITRVESDVTCSSTSSVWRLISFAWEAILLVLAAFLAFQSRDVMAQLNESKSLAVMVYSHFLFVFLRGITSVLYIQATFPASVTAAIQSLIYTLDTLAAMCIYVVPKLLASRRAPDVYKPGMLSSTSTRRDVLPTDDLDMNEEDQVSGPKSENAGNVQYEAPLPKPLSLLVCSANMGNKAPTPESLEAWIPPGGCCDQITPLHEDAPEPNLDSFQTLD